ncbi:hypothetical protein HY624_00495 [Candidatus Uhrbacteria bacterium]|nr:hypothetical protein [Candidatus Uhrbacteria bacterium]
MNAVTQFLRGTCFLFLTVFFGALTSFGVSALVGPWVLDVYESLRGPIQYENAVSMYFFGAIILFMLGWGILILQRWTRERGVLWVFMVFAFVGIASIFIFDTAHRLQAEFSWIRYTTAGALLLTAVASLSIGWWYHRHGTIRFLRWLWWWLAAVFLYAAADEVFQLHEAMGMWLERVFRVDHAVGDYITMGYAVIGLVFLLVFVRTLFREYVPAHRLPIQLLLLGGVFYFLSTLFDTLDGWAHTWLTALGVRLTSGGTFVFSDLWYPLFAPRRFLNSLEEVFENIAAYLFALALVILVLQKYRPRFFDARARIFPRISRACAVVFGGGIILIIFWARPTLTAQSPIIGMDARAVAAPLSHGLSHTDALVYQEPWGVLIGNEGGGNVVSLFNRELQPSLDRDSGMVNVDGLAATPEAIFASDPVRHSVSRYTKQNGWEEFLTRKQGIRDPEGLAVVGDTLYILDETERKIFSVNTKTRVVESVKPKHRKFRAPEGIVYQPARDRFLVTDDVTGYIFSIRWGEEPKIFAGPDAKLRFPEEITVAENGNVFVTDNGTREIIEFTVDGTIVRRIRFRRMYGDLHGIAVVGSEGEQKIYVVTSDGYGSESFMPSMVWEF